MNGINPMTTNPLTREQVAELREWTLSNRMTAQSDQILSLLATVEAQAEVIERMMTNPYPPRPTRVVEGEALWARSNLPAEKWEPMSEVHQIVVYGEVVAPRGESA